MRKKFTFSWFFIFLLLCACLALAQEGDVCRVGTDCDVNPPAIFFGAERKWTKVYSVFKQGDTARRFVEHCSTASVTEIDSYRDEHIRAIRQLITLAEERSRLWPEIAWSAGHFFIFDKGGRYGTQCPWSP